MITPGFPFNDSSKGLLYRFLEPGDQTQLDLLDSSFVTDKIFQVEHQINDHPSSNIGFGFSITEMKLQKAFHKYFPKDDLDDDEDEEDENTFTLVVEDTSTFCPVSSPDTSTAASESSFTHHIIAFITVKFSAWNSRLTIADIEIHPSYRRQGIGKNLIGFAEKVARSRFSIRHIWLEVSNINYPAVRSYLSMGFLVAGLDVSLYDATEAEGEFAIFMRKRVT